MVQNCEKFLGGGGIYQIKNVINGNIYIGSSNDILGTRWKKGHIPDLIKGRHTNGHLQNAWNKYGQNNFEFSVIEECSDCSEENLEEREQWYFNNWAPEYNIVKTAGRPPHNTPTEEASNNRRLKILELRNQGKMQPPKPVIRINLETGEIKEYESAAATELDGFNQFSVGTVCRGQKASHRNYGWEFTDGSSPEFAGTWNKVFIPVIRISEDGSEKTYLTFQELVSDGYNYRKIKSCYQGAYGRRSHCGYTWKFRDAATNEFAMSKADHRTPESNFRAVVRVDSDGCEKNYISISEVERDGFSQRQVGKCCRGERETHRNYHWRFADGSTPIFKPKGNRERRIAMVDMVRGNTIKEYAYIKQVVSDGFAPSAVCCCAQGKRKSHKGFFWKYILE